MECPVCKNDFNENTGRRPKKFCGDSCKVKFWNSKKRALKEVAETVPIIESSAPEKEPETAQNDTMPEFKTTFERLMWESEQELKTKK